MRESLTDITEVYEWIFHYFFICIFGIIYTCFSFLRLFHSFLNFLFLYQIHFYFLFIYPMFFPITMSLVLFLLVLPILRVLLPYILIDDDVIRDITCHLIRLIILPSLSYYYLKLPQVKAIFIFYLLVLYFMVPLSLYFIIKSLFFIEDP